MKWIDYIKTNKVIKTPFLEKDIVELDLSIEIINNAIVYPSTIDLKKREIPSNIFKPNNEKSKNAHHLRGPNNNFFKESKPKAKPDELKKIRGSVLYLGFIIPHYGHFLTESLSRLWALDYINNDCLFLFNTYNKSQETINKTWASDLLRPFGVDNNNVLFPEEGLEIENLILPNQSLILHNSSNNNALAYTWGRILKSNLDSNFKSNKYVYFSRSKIKKKKRVLTNEIDLERKLIEIGFEVYYPEELTLNEQVNISNRADVIIGPSGSALHNAAFMKPKSHVISLTSKNFFLLNEALVCKSTDTNYHVFFGDEHDDINWSIDLEKLTDYLIENNLTPNKQETLVIY